jgi:hypothetical protein
VNRAWAVLTDPWDWMLPGVRVSALTVPEARPDRRAMADDDSSTADIASGSR